MKTSAPPQELGLRAPHYGLHTPTHVERHVALVDNRMLLTRRCPSALLFIIRSKGKWEN